MQEAPYSSIPLRNRAGELVAEALVDAEDFESVNAHRWCRNSEGYAVRTQRDDGKARGIKMHREILGVTNSRIHADHINRNRLDNRRANLRAVTSAQNRQNVPARRKGSSRFRGVSWERVEGRWQAIIGLHGRMYNLGHFSSEVGAARVAEAFRRKHLLHAVPDRSLDPVPSCSCLICRA
jgi:HNH endonuclease